MQKGVPWAAESAVKFATKRYLISLPLPPLSLVSAFQCYIALRPKMWRELCFFPGLWSMFRQHPSQDLQSWEHKHKYKYKHKYKHSWGTSCPNFSEISSLSLSSKQAHRYLISDFEPVMGRQDIFQPGFLP